MIFYLQSFTDFFGIYEVLPGGILLDLMTSILCDPVITSVAPICDNILLRLIGMDTDLINKVNKVIFTQELSILLLQTKTPFRCIHART